MGHHLAAVADEMAVILWTTGRSPMLKTGDFVTVIADRRGRILAGGLGASFQFALIGDLLHSALATYGDALRDGDVLMSNDPYSGMAHMPDIAVVAPVFWEGELVAFCGCYSHQSDIGGRFPGGFSSQCASSYEEGLRIPIVRIHEGGRRNDAVMALISANVRAPGDWIGDVEAKISGCFRGCEGVHGLVDKYGRDTFERACGDLLRQGENASRAAISGLPDGTYRHEHRFSADGLGEVGATDLAVALTIAGDRLTADYSGSAPQMPNALNMPLGVTKAATVAAVQALIGAAVPVNAGAYVPIEVIAPSGSVVNPRFPAAVGGYTPLLFAVCDMVFRTLAEAIPGRVPVPPEGGHVMHFSGLTETGEEFAMMDLFYGGWGGRPDRDGIDGVAPVFLGSHGSVGIELMERQYPLLVEAFGYVPDSGGAGAYRGSLSVYRRWRYLVGGEVAVRTLRLDGGPGMAGGDPAEPAATVLTRDGASEVIAPKTHVHLNVLPGDRLFHSTGGAGGFGRAILRSPDAVREDVRDGKVSVERARVDYGVVLDPDTLTIDYDATRRERAVHEPGSR
jgi:N-methylhydantoinase B